MLRLSRKLLRALPLRKISTGYINPYEHHYQALGIPESSTIREIKEAFNEKCKQIKVEITPDGIKNKVTLQTAFKYFKETSRRVEQIDPGLC